MKIGTKSLLFGVHQVFLHPLFVAWAWWKLYGFPRDPRLWVAFIVHDWGYWGKPNMDGPEGEQHVRLGAKIMYKLFGWDWMVFCLYHSRFFAKMAGVPFSRLCVADKYSIVLTPWWLYLLLAHLSGEIYEYRGHNKSKATGPILANELMQSHGARTWHQGLVLYVDAWVTEHKGGKEDTWTKLVAE
jgi:hypothetical protein